MKEPVQDLAYWRQVGLLALGVLSVVVSMGHFEDWQASHSIMDLKIAVVSAIILPILFTLTNRRWELLFQVSLTMVLLGTVGTILHRSLAALPIVIVCAAISYSVAKYKFKDTIRDEK